MRPSRWPTVPRLAYPHDGYAEPHDFLKIHPKARLDPNTCQLVHQFVVPEGR